MTAAIAKDTKPFMFRGVRYATLTDAAKAGARVPAPIAPERIAEIAAAEAARVAAVKAAKLAAAEAAAATKVEREHVQGKADAAAKARHDEAVRYVATYTGNWGLPLDIKADRKWGTKYLKLSERQVEALLAGKARDAAAAATVVRHPRYAEAVAIASEWSRGSSEFQRAMHVKATSGVLSDNMVEAILRNAPAARPEAPAAPAITEGMWLLDGDVIKVQVAKLGSGNLYAKRLVEGTFVYEAGLIRRMANATRMTVEQAGEFGKLYGMCIVCGRPLTDEFSIANGIGPVCAGKGTWA